MTSKPSVGRTVHYVSYGTPGGEYTSQCRAAIVTEVDFPPVVGEPAVVGLCVLNPTGQFFNRGVEYDPGARTWSDGDGTSKGYRGGTWHWPERVE